MAAYSYTIQNGDTLSGIAQQVCGDASFYPGLAALNNIPNADLIYTGNTLNIDCEAISAWMTGNMRVGTPIYPSSGTAPAQPPPPGTQLAPTPPPAPAPLDPSLAPGDVSPLPPGIPPLPGS